MYENRQVNVEIDLGIGRKPLFYCSFKCNGKSAGEQLPDRCNLFIQSVFGENNSPLKDDEIITRLTHASCTGATTAR